MPKGPTSLSSGTHTKNSISQSSMSSTLMSDILSNAPTPFQPLSGFHTTTTLRPGQHYMHPHHLGNTTVMTPRVTYHSTTTTANARSNLVFVSAGNLQGEDATVTKVVSGGQGHNISRNAPSAVNKHGPTSTKVTTPEGEFPNVTHLAYAQVPPSHMTVHTYIPGHGVMVPTVQQHPMGGGSTLSKMLLTPASPNVRHQRASDHLHHHGSSHDPMAAARLPISGRLPVLAFVFIMLMSRDTCSVKSTRGSLGDLPSLLYSTEKCICSSQRAPELTQDHGIELNSMGVP